MSTQTFSVAPDNTSDAAFRAWAQALHNAIAALGWTQTGDTGQINLSTVTRPVANSTAQGYEIWRTADAGTPIYLKLEFGSSWGTATPTGSAPGIYVTVGQSTNGAGTITGNATGRMLLSFRAVSGQGAAASTCYASGDTSSLRVAMWPGTATLGQWFLIERDQLAGGGDGAWGFVAVGQQVNGGDAPTSGSSAVPFTGAVPTVRSGTLISSLNNNTSELNAGTTYLSAVTVHAPVNALKGLLAYASSDFGALTTFTVSFYGATRTFLALGSQFGTNVQQFNCLAMLYE